MSKTALKKKPHGYTIADCNFDGTPRCFHCGAAFIAATPVKVDKNSVTAASRVSGSAGARLRVTRNTRRCSPPCARLSATIANVRTAAGLQLQMKKPSFGHGGHPRLRTTTRKTLKLRKGFAAQQQPLQRWKISLTWWLKAQKTGVQ